MQTFLAYHPIFDKETSVWSFSNTAEILDGKRLNKQSLEAVQILDILCGRYSNSPYQHHPAVLQWKGYEWILLDYLTDICLECRARKYQNTIYDRINGYTIFMPANASMELPPWMEQNDIFAFHRSRLLFKGRCDAALAALKGHIHLPKSITIRFWLISDASPIVVSNQYVKTKQMSIGDIEQIEDFLYERRIDIPPNHYRQFNWVEPDNIPYVWPVTIASIREKEILETGSLT